MLESAGSLTKQAAPRRHGGDWRGIRATAARPVGKIRCKMSIEFDPCPAAVAVACFRRWPRSAACGVSRPRTRPGMSPERTAALLKARLAEQGVGLVALQVDEAAPRSRPGLGRRRPGRSARTRGSRSARSPRPSPPCSWPTRSFSTLALADRSRRAAAGADAARCGRRADPLGRPGDPPFRVAARAQ